MSGLKVLSSFCLGVIFMYTLEELVEPTVAELQRELDAYKTCMATAGKTRCQMQPADFVRYFEIQEEIERRPPD